MYLPSYYDICDIYHQNSMTEINSFDIYPGLDIGYVPALPHAFFRLSGQFGPQQLILCWPEGPVAFQFFFFLVLAPAVWLTVL